MSNYPNDLERVLIHSDANDLRTLRADNDRLSSELADAHVINHEFDDKLVAARARIEQQNAIIHGMQDGALVRDQAARIAELERHLENSGMYGNAGRYWEGRWRDAIARAERAEADADSLRSTIDNMRAMNIRLTFEATGKVLAAEAERDAAMKELTNLKASLA